jgi:hypothetical protein
VRYYFIREHYEWKDFDIKFVKSEDNESDILTKNCTEKSLKLHAKNVREGMMRAWSNYDSIVGTVALAWRENVEIHESDELWTEVRPRTIRNKSSLRKSKHGSYDS